MTRERVEVRWPDGTVDIAGSWKELLERIGTSRWEESTRSEARAELRRRAVRWSSTIISAVGTDREFFIELERANMVEILEEEGA